MTHILWNIPWYYGMVWFIRHGSCNIGVTITQDNDEEFMNIIPVDLKIGNLWNYNWPWPIV